MTEKDIRRLSRTDLLQLLLELSVENEKLKKTVKELETELAQKKLKIEKAGSIAEAAILVSNVLESAQAAADLYLENIKSQSKSQSEHTVKKEETDTHTEDRYIWQILKK